MFTRFSTRFAAIAASAALFATANVATAAPDPVASAKSKPQEEKVAAADDRRSYCVVSASTGSRLRKKVCKTRSEWIADTGIDPATEK